MKFLAAFFLLIGLVGVSDAARADRVRTNDDTALPICVNAPVRGAGGIVVDGLIDDWSSVTGNRAAGSSSGSFEARCIYDDRSLAIMVNVQDDHIVRVAKGPANEDWVEIQFGRGKSPMKLALFPGNAIAKSRRTLDGAPLPKWISVEDSLQPKGFSIELVIPLAKVPGYWQHIANIPGAIRFHDSDAATSKPGEPIEMTGAFGLSDKVDLLNDFLKSVGANARDIRVDAQARLDHKRKDTQRVIAVGIVIGVLTDQFAYTRLAVSSAADVRKVELIDLRGDGSRVIAATIRQRDNLGERDLLMMFTVRDGQLEPLQPIELRKSQGSNVLESSWKLQTRGHTTELIVRAKDAIGWNATNYNEEPAPDAAPINLPWDDTRYATAFWLEPGNDELQSRAIKRPKQ